MPKIILVVLTIQYVMLGVLKTAERVNFGWLDMVMHIIFIIQSIAALGIMFLYIKSNSEVEMSGNIRDIVNLLNNLVIFLFVVIISLNVLKFYALDLFKL